MFYRFCLCAVFFCSGWAALVYEVSWNRQLGILFGHTVHASAVVLCAYFGGMACGYAVGGRAARWVRSRQLPAARGYAICEATAAAWAAFIPTLLNWAEHGSLLNWLQSSDPTGQWLSRILFSLALLAPATIALGATLPFMADILRSGDTMSGKRAATAYAANTLGALVGVLVASSLLLATWGVAMSTYLAAMVSLACAITAWLLGSRYETSESQGLAVEPTTGDVPGNPAANEDSSTRLWLIAVVVSGAATLMLEVLYARLFSLVFHNSTYTFSFVLVSFLLGISLGSMLIRSLVNRFREKSILTTACVTGATFVPLSAYAFVYFTKLEYFRGGPTFETYFANSLLLVVALTVIPATCFGMILPLAWIADRQMTKRPSQPVGHLTLLNTIAASCGAITASFVLLPLLGLWHSFAFVSLLAMVPTIYKYLMGDRYWAGLLGTVFVVGSIVPLLISDPERWVRRSGSEKLVQRWHSPYGWIDVVELQPIGTRKVQQNLHYRFGATGADAQREFRQAHLPLLLHETPRNVLFLGLGTGMTAAGAVPHAELQSIEIVELIPEVVDAARLLREDNRNIVDDPRTKVIVDDARHYLRAPHRPYDVIVADLFVPWESETGYLYTVEHYERAQQRMAPNGLFCQWLAMYQLGEAEFEMIADSMRHVFPHVTLWWGRRHNNRSVLALVGTNHPLVINDTNLNKRLEALFATGQFHDSLMMDAQQFRELYAGQWPLHLNARLNTDEHPWIEFQTPISHRNNALLDGKKLQTYLRDRIGNLEK